jgi:hypothetical protein
MGLGLRLSLDQKPYSRSVRFELYGPSLYVPIGCCQFPITRPCKKSVFKYYRAEIEGEIRIFSICEFHDKYCQMDPLKEISLDEAIVFEIMES